MLASAQPSSLISCGICQFPGVKVILGLAIFRFLVLVMLTLTSTLPLGFFVRTTPTDCFSSPGVELLATEISFVLLSSIIFTPQPASSSFFDSSVSAPLP